MILRLWSHFFNFNDTTNVKLDRRKFGSSLMDLPPINHEMNNRDTINLDLANSLECYDGLSILEIIEITSRIPIVIATRIVADLAAAVHTVRYQNNLDKIVTPTTHLDLDPSNLVVGNDGIPKILDHRIKMTVNRWDSQNGYIQQQRANIPSEYSANGMVNRRSELFQLGLVLHQLLTSRSPTDGKHPATARSEPWPMAAPSEWRSDCTPELDHIVMSCLARDVEKQTRSALILRNQLLSFLKSRGNPGHIEVALWLNNHCHNKLHFKKKMDARPLRNSEMYRIARGTDTQLSRTCSHPTTPIPRRKTRTKIKIDKLNQQSANTQTRKNKNQNNAFKVLALSALLLWIVLAAIALL